MDCGIESSVGISVESVSPSPSTSWISWGFSRGEAGVDRTTEGIRLCPRFISFSGGAGLSDAVSVSCKGGTPDSNSEGSSLGLAMGSHSTPGFTMRLIVSPSWTLYSFSSLVSANALPFKRSRCAEAGGAWGWSAIWVLMEDMGSAGETGMVMENGGLRDLKVILIVLGANQATPSHSGCQHALRVEYFGIGRTERRVCLFFQLWRRGNFKLDINTCHREVVMFVRGSRDI